MYVMNDIYGMHNAYNCAGGKRTLKENEHLRYLVNMFDSSNVSIPM